MSVVKEIDDSKHSVNSQKPVKPVVDIDDMGFSKISGIVKKRVT